MNSVNRAVRFGEYGRIGLDGNNAFPFMYNFIHSRDDTWDTTKGTTLLDTMAGLGPILAPQQTIQHYIQLDADANFYMKWIKLTAYLYVPGMGPIPAGWYCSMLPAGGSIFWDYVANPQTYIEEPVLQHIRMKVYDHTTGQVLFDPAALGAQQFASVNIPWRQKTFQGYHYGEGQVYTRYLFAKDGTIRLDLTNLSDTFTICVGGFVYGWKARY